MIDTLDKIAQKYSEEQGFERIITQYKIREILKFSSGDKVLDLGCGAGIITLALAKKHKYVVGVDGSKTKIKKACCLIKLNHVKLVCCLFEDFDPKEKFDTVVLANVLEHIEHPIVLLKRVYSWLIPRGRVVATVPNANSFHRKLGFYMGVIKNLKELSREDKEKGHVRVYDKKSLATHFQKAKFRILYLGGVFFKPLPHKMMEKIGNSKLHEALYKMRLEFPDFCSSLIMVGEK